VPRTTDTVKAEAVQWRADRQEWLASVRVVRQEANDKLAAVRKWMMSIRLPQEGVGQDCGASRIRRGSLLLGTACGRERVDFSAPATRSAYQGDVGGQNAAGFVIIVTV
jgi:hypothetical protein